MLTYHRTSLLTSNAQTLVNTVNTVGVMGKGLAAAFKQRDPKMFEQYQSLCRSGQFEIGKLWLWKGSDQWVLNFPTKQHWRNPSKLEYIEVGLAKFVKEFDARGIREIAFPRLGCGNGGLSWENEVQPLMDRFLKKLPIKVYIHDYGADVSLPEHLKYVDGSKSGSFSDFMTDLARAIYKNFGEFQTLTNRSNYQVTFDHELKQINISTEKTRQTIDEIDLFELWLLLQKGPVEVRRMVGGAKEAGYYLLPILVSLEYVRPVKISKDSSAGALAVEITTKSSDSLAAA